VGTHLKHIHQSKSLREIFSPSQKLVLEISECDTTFCYRLKDIEGQVIIATSHLSLYDTEKNLVPVDVAYEIAESSFDETWEQPWGEQRYVRNNYSELSIQAKGFTIRFRLFDESLGFRYELHTQEELTIHREDTEFNVSAGSFAWWIPALGQNHYEHQYIRTSLPEIDTAHTPLTIERAEGGYIAIHEAALYEYGAMNIVPTEQGLVSRITPLQDGNAAKVPAGFNTPWRTIIVSETAVGLGLSKVMLNLNEPSKIPDDSWIQPAKFMGIWWAMFIGYYTWSSGPNHGATTANAIRYINEAKKLGISGLLIEGWNETWDGDWTKNGEKMNHMQPYPDFDIHTITSYAKAQGIDIVGHHETSGNISHYEYELPEAYDYYRLFDVRYIKTGYVAPRMNTGDFHSSQVGVRHYQKTVQLAAERKIMLDIHEPVKGTGIERTWPNLMTREGVMGQEYEGGAIQPEHTTVLPFTRLLAGPLDYTPGLFNLSGTNRKVSTTLSKQLAFYVTMYSPLQMVADLPEHYDGHPAFAFIAAVPLNWDVTIPIDGVIGDYFVTARKDRQSDAWYVGGVSDEQSRTVTFQLDFLEEHKTYDAVIYKDAADSHWQAKPEAYEIERRKVSHHDSLTIRMAESGGFAVQIVPVGENAYPYPD